jgi:outer membrane protein, multidrug efflux system
MTRIATLFVVLVACAPAATSLKVRGPSLPATFERSPAGPSAATIDWRAFFADENLNALIGQAIARNLDLQLALQRIEVTRARVRAASGARLPQVAAFAGASMTRYGRYTPDGAGNASTEIMPGRLTPNPVAELALGLQAAWEVDLWGKLQSLRGSARAQYLASLEGANLVITNLIAEVAVTYFQLLALDHVREVLHETIARQTQALEMIGVQKQAGRTNELAVQQFEAQLASTLALDAGALQQMQELENQLSVLLGRFPGPLRRDKRLLVRDVATTLAAGVPSDLLRNRPDVREAELQIEASRLDLAAARKAFYPRLDITADVGLRAFDPRYLVSAPDSIVSSIVAGLVGPLINRRAIEADFAVAEASQVQAIIQYQSVVLTSFAEVATGLSTLQQAAQAVAHRKRKQAAVAGTVEAADALFRAGKATYLDVLLAQQNTLEAELELIEGLRDQHVASVRLYRALGGGWRGVLEVRGDGAEVALTGASSR